MHQYRRRKKQRPSYGKRLVDVCRSENGFGFTISGQKPCILSCIVPNSPADRAGLRDGDFLIMVNSENVSKTPHEVVVQLINNSVGTIRLVIAENYFSDSSDDDTNDLWQLDRSRGMQDICARRRPKYPHHKLKLLRSHQNTKKVEIEPIPDKFDKNSEILATVCGKSESCTLDQPTSAHDIIHSLHASTKSDITNVSAMVPSMKSSSKEVCEGANLFHLEYRVVIGYVGTISTVEIPQKTVSNYKLQTVQSCIRKMRQEKRQPTIILMQILPNCLKLYNADNALLAKYPSDRLSFVSNNSNNLGMNAGGDRYFGLVTSAAYFDDQMCDRDYPTTSKSSENDVNVSNSCHIFVIDSQLIDHSSHFQQAEIFSIVCTKDPITNCCLEFPSTSEYVVNLINSMYGLNSYSPKQLDIAKGCSKHKLVDAHLHQRNGGQNSPQLSNHSETTTTSSNSDSGIGFNNDFNIITDRIIVVDFPRSNDATKRRTMNDLRKDSKSMCRLGRPPPFNVDSVENIRSTTDRPSADLLLVRSTTNKLPQTSSKSVQESCVSVPNSPQKYDVFDIELSKATSQPAFNVSQHDDGTLCRKMDAMNLNSVTTRSYDDIAMGFQSLDTDKSTHAKFLSSYDDVSLLGDAPPAPPSQMKHHSKDFHFLAPHALPALRKKKMSLNAASNELTFNDSSSHKLRANVFDVISPDQSGRKNQSEKARARTTSEYEESAQDSECMIKDNWGSLQDFDLLNKQAINSYDSPKTKKNVLEPAYSEPNLLTRTLPSNSSPFRYWGQSSFRSRLNENSLNDCRSSSVVASESDVFSKCVGRQNDDSHSLHSQTSAITIDNGSYITDDNNYNGNIANASRRVQSWGTSFEKLLEDTAGLHTFAIFLQKEFSAENIYFWAACERYRKLEDKVERTKEANAIYLKYLAIGASDPVNVDSKARTLTEQNLEAASGILFSQAQKQIFNLMKFDSYQRFIRSEIYEECLAAESKGEPLPYPGNRLDQNLNTSIQANEVSMNAKISSKLKKSLSNAEDRRRKSLLPWHRKVRCKSKDRHEENMSACGSRSNAAINIDSCHSDFHSSRSSLTSFDPAFLSRNGSIDESSIQTSLCRIILSDGATTIVQTRHHESVRDLVDRLLEKRGIFYQSYDCYIAGTHRPVDLTMSSTSIAGKEILIEKRVLFKLDLPNKKIISVKSKPTKMLSEVLKPILHKYNYDSIDSVKVYSKGCSEPLSIKNPVTSIDGLRLQVTIVDDVTNKQKTLNEITNKVFNELMQQKTDAQQKEMVLVGKAQAPQTSPIKQQPYSQYYEQKNVMDLENKGDVSDECCSENSSGNLNALRSMIVSGNRFKTSNNENATLKSDDGSVKPLIAKWKIGAKLQNTSTATAAAPKTDGTDLLEGFVKRAQRFRLEDQRGTKINFELPDFLKDSKLAAAKSQLTEESSMQNNIGTDRPKKLGKAPQPAPRLSISRFNASTCTSNDSKSDSSFGGHNANHSGDSLNTGNDTLPHFQKWKQDSSSSDDYNLTNVKAFSYNGSPSKHFNLSICGPPPLPPKPKIKVLWKNNNELPSVIEKNTLGNSSKNERSLEHGLRNTKQSTTNTADKQVPQPRTVYFDQLNSSFV